ADAYEGQMTGQNRQRLLALMPGLKERAKTLVELADVARFAVAERPLSLDEKAVAILTPDARQLLAGLAELLANAPWTASDLENTVRQFAEIAGVKLGTIAQPLRCALTGTTRSPGIFDVLVALEREESLARINDQADDRAGERPR
ncbi:MAG: glutamate--tRNA ligase, partial [Alphaproteobacteria bacterium]